MSQKMRKQSDEWPEDVSWEDVLEFFPYDSPRDAQVDGMKTSLSAASNEGYFIMEGACGTGKTLIPLAPFMSLVRSDKSKYERIVVVTNVKQQQRAFEDEIERINKNLENTPRSPVSSLTLVGKSDVCPYVQQGEIGDGEIYSRCDSLRDKTSSLVSEENDGGVSAQKLINQTPSGTVSGTSNPDEPNYPYDDEVPTHEESETEFCPFYAKHMQNSSKNNSVPFNLQSEGMISPEKLLELGGEAGTCPHSVMGEALGKVEVVVANYYHLFEPKTVSTFTDVLLDESSLLVVDEAHNIVPTVRDLLNRERAFSSFESAIREAKEIERMVGISESELDSVKAALGTESQAGVLTKDSMSDEVKEVYNEIEEYTKGDMAIADNASDFCLLADSARDTLRKSSFDSEHIANWVELLEDFLDIVDKLVNEKLSEFGSKNKNPPYEFMVQLRDPEEASKKDKISSWMSLYNSNGVLQIASSIGSFIEGVQEKLREEVMGYEESPQFYSASVGGFINNWRKLDDTRYFRTLEMERDQRNQSTENRFDWQDEFNLKFTIYNCIPRTEISSQLQEFGSAVMMSATLEPMNVYRKVIGLDELESSGAEIYERRYGLDFPEKNRMSFTVDAPAYKYNSIGDPENSFGSINTSNEVRKTYAQTISDVVDTTPGNVLICMPSYPEANWAGKLLKQKNINKKVHIDESSTNAQTEQVKQAFFESNNSVLCTGAYGTLIEGIDYKGDRLDAVVCCGVPIENTNNAQSKAVRTAYEEEFGENNGFEYAFTVPAVQKIRQGIGRVIRSNDDIGVRVLVDERYTQPDTNGNSSLEWQKVQSELKDGKSWRDVRNKYNIKGNEWDNVHRFLSDYEQTEFQDLAPDKLFPQLKAFWDFQKE